MQATTFYALFTNEREKSIGFMITFLQNRAVLKYTKLVNC